MVSSEIPLQWKIQFLLLRLIIKILTTEVFEVKGLENDATLDYGKFDFNRPETEKDFEKGKEYEYVAAGIGREEDLLILM